jgi:hypothetical protein
VTFPNSPRVGLSIFISFWSCERRTAKPIQFSSSFQMFFILWRRRWSLCSFHL